MTLWSVCMFMWARVKGLAVALAAVVGVVAMSCVVAAPAHADGPPPVPADSGTGRRIVYDIGTMRVWLVEADETVFDTHLVSGHKGRTIPGVGHFWVFSKSRSTAVLPSRATTMEYMVRFAWGATGIAVGFHSIPMKRGEPLQTVGQLGTPRSSGCVRQKLSDAKLLYDWAPEGTWVVVVDSTGRAPQASLARLPEGPPPPPMPGDAAAVTSLGSTAPAFSVGNPMTGWRL